MKQVLIFIVCYNAENFIGTVLQRIPEALWANPLYNAKVLIIDDQSSDQTYYKAQEYARSHRELPITVLYNAKNQATVATRRLAIITPWKTASTRWCYCMATVSMLQSCCRR